MSYASLYFKVNNVDGKHDVKQIKNEISKFKGVNSVSVNDKAETIAVDFDTTGVSRGRIQEKIEQMGYAIRDSHLENRY